MGITDLIDEVGGAATKGADTAKGAGKAARDAAGRQQDEFASGVDDGTTDANNYALGYDSKVGAADDSAARKAGRKVGYRREMNLGAGIGGLGITYAQAGMAVGAVVLFLLVSGSGSKMALSRL